jgi:hypothetical protein
MVSVADNIYLTANMHGRKQHTEYRHPEETKEAARGANEYCISSTIPDSEAESRHMWPI